MPGADSKLREECNYFVPANKLREIVTLIRDRAAAQLKGDAITSSVESYPRSNSRVVYNLPLLLYLVKLSYAILR